MEAFATHLHGTYAYILIALIVIVAGLSLVLLYFIAKRIQNSKPDLAAASTGVGEAAASATSEELNDFKIKYAQMEEENGKLRKIKEEYDTLQQKVKFLESKLLEYEILQEEIGTLSTLKVENDKLKKEILDLQKEIKGGIKAQKEAKPESVPAEAIAAVAAVATAVEPLAEATDQLANLTVASDTTAPQAQGDPAAISPATDIPIPQDIAAVAAAIVATPPEMAETVPMTEQVPPAETQTVADNPDPKLGEGLSIDIQPEPTLIANTMEGLEASPEPPSMSDPIVPTNVPEEQVLLPDITLDSLMGTAPDTSIPVTTAPEPPPTADNTDSLLEITPEAPVLAPPTLEAKELPTDLVPPAVNAAIDSLGFDLSTAESSQVAPTEIPTEIPTDSVPPPPPTPPSEGEDDGLDSLLAQIDSLTVGSDQNKQP